MKNSWGVPIGGVATYSVIRLWTKGDRVGSLIGMFLVALGPVGCLIAIGVVLALLIEYWMAFIGISLVFGFLVWMAYESMSLPSTFYFYANKQWWKSSSSGVEMVLTPWMQQNFTLEQRKAMQKEFVKALAGSRPDITLAVE